MTQVIVVSGGGERQVSSNDLGVGIAAGISASREWGWAEVRMSGAGTYYVDRGVAGACNSLKIVGEGRGTRVVFRGTRGVGVSGFSPSGGYEQQVWEVPVLGWYLYSQGAYMAEELEMRDFHVGGWTGTPEASGKHWKYMALCGNVVKVSNVTGDNEESDTYASATNSPYKSLKQRNAGSATWLWVGQLREHEPNWKLACKVGNVVLENVRLSGEPLNEVGDLNSRLSGIHLRNVQGYKIDGVNFSDYSHPAKQRVADLIFTSNPTAGETFLVYEKVPGKWVDRTVRYEFVSAIGNQHGSNIPVLLGATKEATAYNAARTVQKNVMSRGTEFPLYGEAYVSAYTASEYLGAGLDGVAPAFRMATQPLVIGPNERLDSAFVPDGGLFVVTTSGAITVRQISGYKRRTGYFRYGIVLEDSPFGFTKNVNLGCTDFEAGITMLSAGVHNDFSANEWSEGHHSSIQDVVGDGCTASLCHIGVFGSGFAKVGPGILTGQAVTPSNTAYPIWVKEGNHKAYLTSLTGTALTWTWVGVPASGEKITFTSRGLTYTIWFYTTAEINAAGYKDNTPARNYYIDRTVYNTADLQGTAINEIINSLLLVPSTTVSLWVNPSLAAILPDPAATGTSTAANIVYVAGGTGAVPADNDTFTVTDSEARSCVFTFKNTPTLTTVGSSPYHVQRVSDSYWENWENLQKAIALWSRAGSLDAFGEFYTYQSNSVYFRVHFYTHKLFHTGAPSCARTGTAFSAPSDISNPYRPSIVHVESDIHWSSRNPGGKAHIRMEKVYELATVTGTFTHVEAMTGVTESAQEQFSVVFTGTPGIAEHVDIRPSAAGTYKIFLFDALAVDGVPANTIHCGVAASVADAYEKLANAINRVGSEPEAAGAHAAYSSTLGAVKILKGLPEADASFVVKTGANIAAPIRNTAAGLASIATQGNNSPIQFIDCTAWSVNNVKAAPLSLHGYAPGTTTFAAVYLENVAAGDDNRAAAFRVLPMQLIYAEKSGAGVVSKGSVRDVHLHGPFGAGRDHLSAAARMCDVGGSMSASDISVAGCYINGYAIS